MRKFLLSAVLCVLSLSALAGGNDIVFTKRNAADTAQGPLTPPHPTTSPGIMFYDSATLLPGYLYLGPGLSITSGILDVASSASVTWSTLGGKPAWTGAFVGTYASLTGQPTLGTAAALNVAASGNASGSQVAKGDDTRLADARTPTAHTHVAADITDATATGRAVMASADAAAARTAIGAGTSSFGGTFSALTGKPTSLSGYGITDAYPLSGNPSGFLTTVTSGQVTAALGFTPYSAANPAGYVTSSSLSTTLGSYASTAALTTGLSGKFDTPAGTAAQYVRGDGTLAALPAPGAGTVTSITAGTGLSGGTITGAGTISMPSTGTTGTYSSVTTDAQGRVIAGTARSFANQTRALNTCFQVSSSRDAHVTYGVEVATIISLTTGQVGTVYLETFTDGACTTGTQEVVRSVSGNAGALTIGLNLTQTSTAVLPGLIPAGTWVKLRTQNNTGTPTFTARPGQEVLL